MDYEHLDLTLDSREEVRCKSKFRPVIKNLRKRIHFSEEEAMALLIIHYKLTKKKPIDRKYFRIIMFKLLDYSNETLIERIYSVFGETNNKTDLPMESWLLGLSTICRGTLEEKIKFCFTVYDMMGDGVLRKDFMFQALKNNFRSEDDNRDLVMDLIDSLVKKLDLNNDGMVTFDDYSEAVRRNPALLEVFGFCIPSRVAIYNFMSTYTSSVTTMHHKSPHPRPL